MSSIYKKTYCPTIIEILYDKRKLMQWAVIRDEFERRTGYRPWDKSLRKALEFLIKEGAVLQPVPRGPYSLDVDFRRHIGEKALRRESQLEHDRLFWEHADSPKGVQIPEKAPLFDVRPSQLKSALEDGDFKAIERKVRDALESHKLNDGGVYIVVRISRRPKSPSRPL